MSNIAPYRVSQEEAGEITQTLQAEFRVLSSSWVELARKVQAALDRGVPGALGMGRREWLERTFDRSGSFLMSQLDDLRALQGVPEEIAGQICEYNAHELAKLPEQDRRNPVILRAAVNDRPDEFRDRVKELRRTKYGLEPDKWKSLVRPLPAELVDRWEAQEKRIAAVLQIRLPRPEEELRAWKAAEITVWERLITLMEQTDNFQLMAWVNDENPNDREE